MLVPWMIMIEREVINLLPFPACQTRRCLNDLTSGTKSVHSKKLKYDMWKNRTWYKSVQYIRFTVKLHSSFLSCNLWTYILGSHWEENIDGSCLQKLDSTVLQKQQGCGVYSPFSSSRLRIKLMSLLSDSSICAKPWTEALDGIVTWRQLSVM